VRVTDYGEDFSCASDLATTLGTASGRTVVVEAIARRLTTPRGRLLGDEDYGFDLTDYANDDVSPADIAWIGSQVEAECLKDERVSLANTTAVLGAGDILTVTVAIVLSDGDAFDLTLAVSSVSVPVLSVE
jgi:hypothetical protein